MNTRVILSGGFDPLHSGHVAMIEAAANLGDEVVVLLNSDKWLSRKKGRPFMSFGERKSILKALRGVCEVVSVDDGDGTVCNGLHQQKVKYPESTLIFANGGDRQAANTPETALCDALGITVEWNVGGGKKASSSELLGQWLTDETVTNPWGRWTAYRNFTTSKIKEVTILPGKRTSCHKHDRRSESWFVAEGEGELWTGDMVDQQTIISMSQHQTYGAPVRLWHMITNTGKTPLRLVEIQYGDLCIEEDITRWPEARAVRTSDLHGEDISAIKNAISGK